MVSGAEQTEEGDDDLLFHYADEDLVADRPGRAPGAIPGGRALAQQDPAAPPGQDASAAGGLFFYSKINSSGAYS